MSRADREKWDARYRAGEYQARFHPSALLVQWLPQLDCLAGSSALDVACGLGRNAVYLARQGWQVDALDISQVALDRLAATARDNNLDIRCMAMDLERDAGLLASEQYELALMVRYTDLALIPSLANAVKPGGFVIVEKHLVTEAEVVGPSNPRFRVAPGTLRSAASGLDIIAYQEGLVVDPDGRTAALAQLIARRGSLASSKTGRD